jgi:hypothetical protein
VRKVQFSTASVANSETNDELVVIRPTARLRMEFSPQTHCVKLLLMAQLSKRSLIILDEILLSK